jgi:hypothetical protein
VQRLQVRESGRGAQPDRTRSERGPCGGRDASDDAVVLELRQGDESETLALEQEVHGTAERATAQVELDLSPALETPRPE